jgi:hypothetical protein
VTSGSDMIGSFSAIANRRKDFHILNVVLVSHNKGKSLVIQTFRGKRHPP